MPIFHCRSAVYMWYFCPIVYPGDLCSRITMGNAGQSEHWTRWNAWVIDTDVLRNAGDTWSMEEENNYLLTSLQCHACTCKCSQCLASASVTSLDNSNVFMKFDNTQLAQQYKPLVTIQWPTSVVHYLYQPLSQYIMLNLLHATFTVNHYPGNESIRKCWVQGYG